MFLFKENYAMFTRNIDKAIRFYQDSFMMRMYNLSEDGKEALLENISDSKLLRLVEIDKFTPSEITIYSDEISAAHKIHLRQDIIIKDDPMNAVYSVEDLDGNKIIVVGESEQIVLDTNDSFKDGVSDSDDDSVDELAE